jgi:hypothetical protein
MYHRATRKPHYESTLIYSSSTGLGHGATRHITDSPASPLRPLSPQSSSSEPSPESWRKQSQTRVLSRIGYISPVKSNSFHFLLTPTDQMRHARDLRVFTFCMTQAAILIMTPGPQIENKGRSRYGKNWLGSHLLHDGGQQLDPQSPLPKLKSPHKRLRADSIQEAHNMFLWSRKEGTDDGSVVA